MDIITQKQQPVQCEVISGSGHTLEAAVDRVTNNQHTVTCDVLTDSRQTVKNSIGHRDKEPTDRVVLGTDRLWIDCTVLRSNKQ